MATDVRWKKCKNEAALQTFLAENDIDRVDIIALYSDVSARMPVVWYTLGMADVSGPAIRHTTIADNKPIGVAVPVYVQAAQDVELSVLQVYYRTTGAPAYVGPIDFELQGDGVTWLAEIPASVVQAPSVDYYVYAEDPDANTTTLGNAGAPLVFTAV